jgi:hypothetical protein
MLWPLILPFQIIFYFLVGMLIVAVIGLRVVKREWRRPFLWALGLIGLVFALAFPFVMNEIDARRFGVFRYATINDVQDLRVTRYLPPTAHDIIVDKQRQGFRARYKITEAALSAYTDDLWRKYGDRAKVPRDEMGTSSPGGSDTHKHEFGDLNWPMLPADAKEFNSPRAANSAGFFIWHSPSTGIAYERADYW